MSERVGLVLVALIPLALAGYGLSKGRILAHGFPPPQTASREEASGTFWFYVAFYCGLAGLALAKAGGLF